MMDQYLQAWLIYLGASCALLWLGWSWTRAIPFAWLRNSIRALGAVILLTPVAHEDVADMLVPAWIVASLGILTDGMEVAVNAMVLLALAAVAGLLLVMLHSIARALWGRSTPKTRPERAVSPSVNETGRTDD